MKIILAEAPVNGESLIFTNKRAIFWEHEQALIISDLHIGKTAHFRKNGIPLPRNIFEKDLERLSLLLHHFEAKKIYIVGDLLHAGNNADVDYFCGWKQLHCETEFHLIKGNHDRISAETAVKICLASQSDRLDFPNFSFVHKFQDQCQQFQINGHIHPGIVLKTSVRNYRFPCYAITHSQLILPAFSEFTGLDIKNTPQQGKFGIFTQDEIYFIEK